MLGASEGKKKPSLAFENYFTESVWSSFICFSRNSEIINVVCFGILFTEESFSIKSIVFPPATIKITSLCVGNAVKNKVEKMGVDKSLSFIDKADLVILVLNNNEVLTNDDLKILDKTKNKKRIINN